VVFRPSNNGWFNGGAFARGGDHSRAQICRYPREKLEELSEWRFQLSTNF